MECISKQYAREWVESLPDDVKLCPNCYEILAVIDSDDGKILHCPNELCLNEDHYDLHGNSFE